MYHSLSLKERHLLFFFAFGMLTCSVVISTYDCISKIEISPFWCVYRLRGCVNAVVKPGELLLLKAGNSTMIPT